MSDPSTGRPPISDGSGVTDAVRVQILSTEHWSLLATRGLIWNETFSRASMFITLLSASLVAIALVAQATLFGASFRVFALLILPVVLLMGLVTFVRLSDVNTDDIGLLIAMNRLRHAYLELAPELGPYFTTGHHDDMTGIFQSFGLHVYTTLPPELLSRLATADDKEFAGLVEANAFPGRLSVIRLLSATPSLVGTINAVVFGAFAALVADTLGVANPVTVIIGVAAAIIVGFVQLRYGFQQVARTRSAHRPRFPHSRLDQNDRTA